MTTFCRKVHGNVQRTFPVINSSVSSLLNAKDRVPFSEVFLSCLTLGAEYGCYFYIEFNK